MKKFTEYFAALLLVLLPLKFGTMAVMPESGGYYPENFTDWPIGRLMRSLLPE